MERSGRKGYISVDSLRTEFSCPGISANLDIDEPIFLGAVPWPDPFSSQQNNNNYINVETVTIIELEEKLEFKRNFPSSVWTINLQKGFLGCMKNIRLNGINIEIAHMFQSNKLLLQNEKQLDNNNYKTKINESIFLGCPFSFSFDYCKKSGNKNLCKNGGVCSSFHNTFICDCSDTPFDGINCQQKPHPIPFPLPSSLSAKFIFSDPWQLEAENLEIKFKPKLEFNFNEEKKLFVLIDTKLFKNKQKLLEKDENKQRFLVAITGTGGILINWIFQGNEENIFNLTSANITNNWNTFKLIRRGHRIGVKLNGKWNNITLNNDENNKRLILSIKELAIAQPIGTNKISNNLEHLFRFHGDLRILSLNGHDLLRPIRIMKRQKGSSTSSQNKEELNSEYFEGLKEIKMENKHRNLSVDKIWKMEGKYYQTTKSQPLNNKKFNNESSFSSISSTFFFTKSPLGCLRQNARNCIPEPSIEDSFFTPIISKSLNWGEQIKTTTLSTPTTELTTNKLPINSFSTSSLTTTTTTLKTITTTTSRKRPHSWTRTKTNAPIQKPSIISTTPRKTLAPRFPVGPNDPTLYAVRPTTPMNGASQYSQHTPSTSLVPSTSNNQLGDDKKYLIGVGSLSIVVMLGAILLCVFCKRPHQFCAQMAAAAGGQNVGIVGQSSTSGPKSGYTPIPPNEFSPQVQHHQMREFESNNNGVGAGRVGTLAGSTQCLLRNGNGGAIIGNGNNNNSSAVGFTERTTGGGAKFTTILAQGNGSNASRETIAISKEVQQPKREFKEWYV